MNIVLVLGKNEITKLNADTLRVGLIFRPFKKVNLFNLLCLVLKDNQNEERDDYQESDGFVREASNPNAARL
jgi:hypothetical protein